MYGVYQLAFGAGCFYNFLPRGDAVFEGDVGK